MTSDADAHSVFRSIADTFSARSDVRLGRMLKAESLQVGGRSFAYPTDGAIVFKLPKSQVDALQDDGHGVRLVVGKREMKEWVAIPASDKDLCEQMAELACQFVSKD